jgi:multidrug efflux pump subunit AcrA (membrane-fusion protein)
MSDQPAAPVNTLRIDRDTSSDTTGRPSAAARRTTPRRRTITRGVLIVVFVMIVIAIISNITSQPRAVETATATRMYLSQSRQVLIASGYVVAQRKASVASKGTGRLVALNVVEGDRVRAGDILARIESGDVDAAHAQAQAALAQAKAALVQSEAEARDASLAWKRAQALIAVGNGCSGSAPRAR